MKKTNQVNYIKMKKLMKVTTVLFLLSMLFAPFMNAQVKQNLEPFPAASEGMVRHVIELPKKSDESKLKVEIIPGKMMLVDCNHHTLLGKLVEKDLKGWGYTYYEFASDGKTMSTLMGCNVPDVNKFISAEGLLVRYNSKLPIVIYAPVGYDIKYRIWKADKEKVSVVK